MSAQYWTREEREANAKGLCVDERHVEPCDLWCIGCLTECQPDRERRILATVEAQRYVIEDLLSAVETGNLSGDPDEHTCTDCQRVIPGDALRCLRHAKENARALLAALEGK